MQAKDTSIGSLSEEYIRTSTPDSMTQWLDSSSHDGSATPNTLADSSDHGVLFDTFDVDADRRDQNNLNKEYMDEFRNRNDFTDYLSEPSTETRCSILPQRLAVWRIARTNIRLSALAATVLMNEHKILLMNLEIFGDQDQSIDKDPSDPISGIIAATHSTVGSVVMGVVDYPVEINKMIQSDREVTRALATDFALDSGKGISRILGAGLRAPMDFSMNISKGFGNVPRLYGDDTVRNGEKVTGIDSGIGAAVKGLGFGLYDGITGLVTQPMKGARESGIGGFLTGLGKGIGGAIFKPAAGAVGVPAYAFKGIYEEIQSARGLSPEDQLKAKQVAQGQKEWEMCTVDERADILGKWYYDF